MAAVRGRGRSEMGRLFGPLTAPGGTHNTSTPRVVPGGLTCNVGWLLTRMLVLFVGG